MKKITSKLVLFLFLSSIWVVFSGIRTVWTDEVIYIKADGSVVGTDKIQRAGNIYTLTGDISGSIIVEKDNLVINGAGYTLQGNGTGTGISLYGRKNVSVQNIRITAFFFGLRMNSSSNNSIHGNTATNNNYGIYIDFSSNNVLRNNLMNNNTHNFWISGEYVNDIDASNTVDGKPIYYWVNQQDRTIPSDAGYVGLVNCNNIIVQNLNLTNNRQGILLVRTTNSVIAGNTITNNVRGIRFFSSSNNTIQGNSITANEISGIGLDSSSNNTIQGNSITANRRYGIWLFDTSNSNLVYGNNITNSMYGVLLPHFSNFNRVNGNNIIDNDLGVWVDSSSNNTIQGNHIANNGDGIWLYSSSSFNTICENHITDNQYGLLIYNFSNFNSVYGNNVTDNDLGVWLSNSSNNSIFHNNFDNTQQVVSENSTNLWDDGYPSGGNYWSNYNGTDNDNDGIGDVPYSLNENNQDNYPLVNPWIPSTHQSEPFPTTWIITAMSVIAISSVALLLYFTKIRKVRGKAA